MKKAMKKALEIILSMVCLAAIILAGAENADGSCNIKWTMGFLALAVASGYLLNRIMKR